MRPEFLDDPRNEHGPEPGDPGCDKFIGPAVADKQALVGADPQSLQTLVKDFQVRLYTSGITGEDLGVEQAAQLAILPGHHLGRVGVTNQAEAKSTFLQAFQGLDVLEWNASERLAIPVFANLHGRLNALVGNAGIDRIDEPAQNPERILFLTCQTPA